MTVKRGPTQHNNLNYFTRKSPYIAPPLIMDKNTANEHSTYQSGSIVTFGAAHLDIIVDHNNPRPSISENFDSLRQQVNTTWHNLEAAEGRLVALDDSIDTSMLDYVSVNQNATAQQVWAERFRLTIQEYKPAIKEVEKCCGELESRIEALGKAAHKESETLEGQAALEIDVNVLRRCLDTTMEIVEAARAQLEQARIRSGGA